MVYDGGSQTGNHGRHTIGAFDPAGRREREMRGSRGRLLGRLLLLGLMLALAGEAVLTWMEDRATWVLEEERREVYSFELRDGLCRRLSSTGGLLKLEVSPVLGYRTLPNQATPYFRINARGFRGPEIAEHAPPGTIRIALTGGSAVFGTGLRGDEETIAAHLQRLVRDSEVINAGVIGYASGDELHLLAETLPDLHLDRVVSISGWNDYFTAVYYETSLHTDHGGFHAFVEQLADLRRATHPNLLIRYTYGPAHLLFPNIMRKGIGAFRKQRLIGREKVDDATVAAAARSYVSNLVRMERLAAASGAGFTAMLQPFLPEMQLRAGVPLSEPSLIGLARGWQRFREESLQAAARTGLTLHDLGSDPERLPADHFIDGGHLDEAGCRRLAADIAERLGKKGVEARRDAALRDEPDPYTQIARRFLGNRQLSGAGSVLGLTLPRLRCPPSPSS